MIVYDSLLAGYIFAMVRLRLVGLSLPFVDPFINAEEYMNIF